MATFWEIYQFLLCILTYCNFSYFPFGFEGGTLVPIASVPSHCLFFTLSITDRSNAVLLCGSLLLFVSISLM